MTATTAGQTFRPLDRLALLAPRRPGNGPQGFPVNKTAYGARVTELIRDPSYRLVVDGRVERELSFSLAELRALPQHEARHAITCVEGWSAEALWTGVRIRDLLAMAGADPASEVRVHSLQKRGIYAKSELNVPHAQNADTLLALRVGGEELHPDHGYPARLIAPNRPGVQQTKWVARLEVV